MKTLLTKYFPFALCTALILPSLGCNRQTRGNADAQGSSQAASPEEGGATSTKGAAGEAKNFGDTRAKQKEEGISPSASPTGVSQDAKAGQSGGAVNPPTSKENPK